MPSKEFEHANIRSALWRFAILLMKAVHRRRFTGRRFGTDVQLLLVYGSCFMFYLENDITPVRASSVARFLDMPHETVRRHLQSSVKLGLLARESGGYVPTAKLKTVNLTRVEKLMEQVANEFWPSRDNPSDQ